MPRALVHEFRSLAHFLRGQSTWLGLLTLLVFLTTLVPVAPAVAATLRADCGLAFGTYFDTDGGVGTASAACSGSRTVGASIATGTAEADAASGQLRAGAQMQAQSIGQARAEATAAWFDDFTLTATGVPDGTTVQMLVGVFIEGTLDAAVNGSASFVLRLGVCGGNPFCAPSSTLASDTYTTTSGNPVVGTIVERLLNITIGQQTGISMQLDVQALKLETPGQILSGGAESNFLGTAYWDGVRDVLLNGASISFELMSGSGIDLRQSLRPVPLPAAGWLCGSVLCVAGLRLRASRRSGAGQRHSVPPCQV